MKKNWKTIDDNKVRMIWKCPVCGEKAMVDPSFYQDAGTPICTGTTIEEPNCEGEDMEYVRTEIQK